MDSSHTYGWDPSTTQEPQKAVNQLASGKAPGTDSIPTADRTVCTHVVINFN